MPPTTFAPIDPLKLPERPEDLSPISQLGRRYQAVVRAQRHLDDFPSLATLRKQLSGYRETVDRATPASDMIQVAAAEAGIRVVERALAPLEVQVRDARRSADELAAGFEREWQAYRLLVVQANDGHPSDRDQATAQIIQLAG